MIFSRQEMWRRLDAITNAMNERDIDAVFLHTADHSFYFSGVPLLSEWGRPMWSVIHASGKSVIFGAAMELENMENFSYFEDIRVFDDNQSVRDAAIEMVKEALLEGPTPPKRIGLELELIPLALYRALRDAMPDVEFVEVGDIIQGLRCIKSAEEIALLKMGGKVAIIGANAFIEACHEFTTELHISSYAVHEMNKAIAAFYPDYDGGASSSYSYCQLGLHSLTPHLHPTNRQLHRGDIVALNVFPVIWGYAMMLERTFIFGEPTDEQYRALEAATMANKLGREAIKPGADPASINELCENFLRERGYGEQYFRHGVGHSQGIMIGAAGREKLGDIRSYNHTPFVPGQITSSGPGIYIPGLGGFRQNDAMLITESGAEELTDFTRDIGHCL